MFLFLFVVFSSISWWLFVTFKVKDWNSQSQELKHSGSRTITVKVTGCNINIYHSYKTYFMFLAWNVTTLDWLLQSLTLNITVLDIECYSPWPWILQSLTLNVTVLDLEYYSPWPWMLQSLSLNVTVLYSRSRTVTVKVKSCNIPGQEL
jgi:hypothetical protein